MVVDLKSQKRYRQKILAHISPNGRRLGGRFNAAKPLLYEVPTYLALNLNRSDKQKNKKKKSDGKNKFL
ncbi:MAG: hypothetical protein L6Q54_11545 [Leptospiraceae bacterium]|nr:hypothetical protein [Leptospiraceae bacterium]